MYPQLQSSEDTVSHRAHLAANWSQTTQSLHTRSLVTSLSLTPTTQELLRSGKSYSHRSSGVLLQAGALHMVTPWSLGYLREGTPIVPNCRSRDSSKDVQNTCSRYRATDSLAHFLPDSQALSHWMTPNTALNILPTSHYRRSAVHSPTRVCGSSGDWLTFPSDPHPTPAFPNPGHIPFPLPLSFATPSGVSSPSKAPSVPRSSLWSTIPSFLLRPGVLVCLPLKTVTFSKAIALAFLPLAPVSPQPSRALVRWSAIFGTNECALAKQQRHFKKQE